MVFNTSEQARTIKIYNLRSDTNEFIGAGDAYIPP
ncbi:tail fiber assembly like-protein [Salmonella enterica subsp. houtenae serovar 50:g,z51:- str. 01-0133]|nr:tail fiber assembly like-protein [Salmonella enterica subsp. houtenae serovar 50:g,z51:- str. 01-0133]SUF52421.1 tail assembly protein [Salmonella enterica]VEA93805.1 tail assembly protein [Salmonella enterica subsp. houtenae]VFS08111.1 tail assembly protein [Salmonella enterica subsp. houtenae]VUD25744.1 tail assembly protein [Salmonella sp. NCTC 7297]